MELLFTREAERDLEEIGDYIATDNPARAVTFIREIRSQCERIARVPLSYRARPELGAGIRTCPHKRYVIVFKPEKTRVLIVRVLHGARDIDSILGGTK